MAARWRARAIAALGIAMTGGCTVAPYACTDDDQCRLGGRDGHCEAVGFCSYSDGDCPSGARFSDHADDARAGQCVDGSFTSSADDASSEEACTDDCPDPGATLWMTEPYDGQALAMAHDGARAIVVGSASSDGAGSASFALAIDDEGELAWGPLVESGPLGVRVARGIAVDADGEVWAVGDEDGPAGARAWAQQLSTTGEVLDLEVFDTLADDRFVAATSAIAAVAGGTTDGGAWLRSLGDDDRELLVPAHTLVALAGRDDGALAALLAPDDGALVLHVHAPGGAVIAANPSAIATATAIALARDGSVLSAGADNSAALLVRSDIAGAIAWSSPLADGLAIATGIEHDDGDISIAGTLGEGTTRRPWVARLDPAGTQLWQRTLDDAAETTVVGAARRDDGSVVIAGWRGAFPRVWLAAIAP